jgi:dUTP pyrophosphatase
MKANVSIVKLKSNATIPTQGSSYSAGYDLYACIDEPIEILPHTTVKIGTGLCVELPEGTFGAIFARSGLATKMGLRPANCVGI